MTAPLGRRTLLSALLWTLSGDLLSKVAVLATTLIAVRGLAPTHFGQFIGFSATAVLAASLWDAGVSTLLTREVAAGGLPARAAVLRTARLRLLTLPLWLLVFVVGAAVLTRGRPVSAAGLLAWAAASLAFGCHSVPLALLRGRLRFRAAGLALLAGRLLTAALSATVLVGTGLLSGLTVLALALCAGELTTLGAAAAVAARGRSDGAAESGERPAAAGERLTLRAALPFAANGVLATAYNRFDIVLLAALASADQLSLYAPATRIQDALYFIPSALGAIALPIFARGAQRAEEAVPLAPTLARFIVLGLLAGLPLAVGLTLTAGAVLPLVLGPEYVGAAPATRIMVWSLPVSVIGAPLLAALAARGHAAATTQAFAVAFMVAIALHLALDPVWGATGAAVAGVLRDGANLLTGAWLAHRVGLFASRPAPAYAPAVARSDVRG